VHLRTQSMFARAQFPSRETRAAPFVLTSRSPKSCPVGVRPFFAPQVLAWRDLRADVAPSTDVAEPQRLRRNYTTSLPGETCPDSTFVFTYPERVFSSTLRDFVGMSASKATIDTPNLAKVFADVLVVEEESHGRYKPPSLNPSLLEDVVTRVQETLDTTRGIRTEFSVELVFVEVTKAMRKVYPHAVFCRKGVKDDGTQDMDQVLFADVDGAFAPLVVVECKKPPGPDGKPVLSHAAFAQWFMYAEAALRHARVKPNFLGGVLMNGRKAIVLLLDMRTTTGDTLRATLKHFDVRTLVDGDDKTVNRKGLLDFVQDLIYVTTTAIRNIPAE